MNRFRLACLALVVLVCGARADDKDAAVRKELKRLNGTWETARIVVDGTEVPAEWKMTMVVKGGKYTFKQGDELLGEGTIRVDPKARTLDLNPFTGPFKGKSFLGVYDLKGDEYTLCRAWPGKPRPKVLESKEGSGHLLTVWKRVKR